MILPSNKYQSNVTPQGQLAHEILTVIQHKHVV